MYRSPITHRFSATGSAGYFELAARVSAPTVAVLRPAAPARDPRTLAEIGHIRWCDAINGPEFRSTGIALDARDVAAIASALEWCCTRTAFDRYRR